MADQEQEKKEEIEYTIVPTEQPTSRHERQHCLKKNWVMEDDKSIRSAIPLKRNSTHNWGKKQYIEKDGEGRLIFSSGMYPDDIVAAVLSLSEHHLNTNEEEIQLKQHLSNFVNGMDDRAWKRHKYSHNPVEAELKWEPVTPSTTVVKKE